MAGVEQGSSFENIIVRCSCLVWWYKQQLNTTKKKRNHHDTPAFTSQPRRNAIDKPPNMVVTRKERRAKDIKLSQPDRSGPTEKTLLQLAEERNLFNMADQQQLRNDQAKGKAASSKPDEDDELSPAAERIMEALLYAVCMAMLHFTLDYLVQHQYAMEIEMPKIVQRSLVALFGSFCSSALPTFQIILTKHPIFQLQSLAHSSTPSTRILRSRPSSPACRQNTTTPSARPSSSWAASQLAVTSSTLPTSTRTWRSSSRRRPLAASGSGQFSSWTSRSPSSA